MCLPEVAGRVTVTCRATTAHVEDVRLAAGFKNYPLSRKGSLSKIPYPVSIGDFKSCTVLLSVFFFSRLYWFSRGSLGADGSLVQGVRPTSIFERILTTVCSTAILVLGGVS